MREQLNAPKRIADSNNKKLQRREHFTLLRNAVRFRPVTRHRRVSNFADWSVLIDSNLADPLLAVLPFLHNHEFLQRKYDNAWQVCGWDTTHLKC